eukprot:CAMPEP_0174261788 /NCGR_PEP_ID=MMETSP0439-20130205/12184_1 /TAXON_ID=0 /ORGANISM="Stereomyxa ramosa, Strain Chinc5" /LENGTH=148 /DNA_ID=CAMNT_0015346353 /DNA_START=180 /DNA_END=623 /DNA_ORIENTATION=+
MAHGKGTSKMLVLQEIEVGSTCGVELGSGEWTVVLESPPNRGTIFRKEIPQVSHSRESYRVALDLFLWDQTRISKVEIMVSVQKTEAAKNNSYKNKNVESYESRGVEQFSLGSTSLEYYYFGGQTGILMLFVTSVGSKYCFYQSAKLW